MPPPTGPADQLIRCVQFLRLLRDDLKVLLQEPADPASADWISALVDKLLVDVKQEFALKERGEYLGDVLEQFPSWQPQVARLLEEHQSLTERLREIRDRIAQEAATGGLSTESCQALREWIDADEGHEHRERDLVQEACTHEVGGRG